MYYSICFDVGQVADDQCHQPVGAPVHLQFPTAEAVAKFLESLASGRNRKSLRQLAALVRESGPPKGRGKRAKADKGQLREAAVSTASMEGQSGKRESAPPAENPKPVVEESGEIDPFLFEYFGLREPIQQSPRGVS